MALENSNIDWMCDTLIMSEFFKDPELIIRLVDNIFVCCKYREFYVEQYAFLLYSLYRIIRKAKEIRELVNSGSETKESIDPIIFTYRNLSRRDRTYQILVKRQLNSHKSQNAKVTSRRKSLILSEKQILNGNKGELNDDENQIVSVIKIKNNEDENSMKNDQNDTFFEDFVMKSDSIISVFLDRVFTLNQSTAKQPWKLFCIYKCMEIFNEEEYFNYIEKYFLNLPTWEVEEMYVFAYFAPMIKAHFPNLFNDLHNEMKKKYKYSRLPFSFNEFYQKFELTDESNWNEHSTIMENCGFTKGTPMFAIRNDDVNFFITRKDKLMTSREKFGKLKELNEKGEVEEDLIDLNMRVRENIYIRYPQLKNRCTLLQLAAYYGSEKCFRFLLENGADPNLEDYIGLKVMHFAVLGGSHMIIQTLQKLGYSFDIGSISLVVECYRFPLFQWLNSVISINYEESFLQTGTIIHRAASGNNILILLFLISKGFNVNVFDNLNLTPLFYAATNRSIDAINLLLSHKDIIWDLADKFKDTPLHGAAKSNDCDSFNALMKHKDANINVKDFHNKSPIKYCIGDGKYDVSKMIFSKYKDEYDFDEVDHLGENLSFTASFSGFLNTFTLVCENERVNLNVPRFDGFYSIHLIVASNKTDFVRVYLDQERADPNLITEGTAPLHIAAKKNFHEIVQLFVNNKKTNVNLKDDSGMTPIHIAIQHNNFEAVKILMESNRVDPNVTFIYNNFFYS